ncbi:hypothetical protein [Paenibacillus amylolyticus]|uniref:hypothetical protein n=1 Tax=Paenibacillus amylolyticus TaxID=1451 RepID=UPI0015C50383|nr:hypothetical protein [Paenibacillus amylolyticus]
MMHYIIDEFDILTSKEKCRQLLKDFIVPTDLSKTNLKNGYKGWLNDPDTAIWIYGHLYLGTQNRDAKFKSGKKPYIDDDLLKTQEEIFEEKIDLSNKSRPELAICMINIKTKQMGCKMLEHHLNKFKICFVLP